MADERPTWASAAPKKPTSEPQRPAWAGAAASAPATAPPPAAPASATAPTKTPPSALDKAIDGMFQFAAAGPETAAHMITGLGGKLAGDLAMIGEGGASLLAPKKLGWFGQDARTAMAGKAVEDQRNLQRDLTYQPRTRAGRLASEYNPMALIGKGMGWLGKEANQLIAPPGSGLARRTAGSVAQEAIPDATMLLGGPAAEGAGGVAQAAGRTVMKSAFNAPRAAKASGDLDIAVDEMFKHGLKINEKGVGQIEDMSTKLTKAVDDVISENADKTIDRWAVSQYAGDAFDNFRNTIKEKESNAEIEKIWDDFLDPKHPSLMNNRDIPIQQAQAFKRAEGRQLKGEYGQQGTPSIEARKAIVRGFKEKIEEQLPKVGPINEANSRLLTTLPLVERRALTEAAHNPIGLAWMATNPAHFALWLGKHSALFQSIVAQMLHQGGSGLKAAAPVAPVAGAAMIQPPPQSN